MCEGDGVKWGNQSLVLDTKCEILIWHPSEDIQQAIESTYKSGVQRRGMG